MIRNYSGTYDKFDYLHQVFLGMHQRTLQKGHMDVAVEVLKQHYENLEQHFFDFMPKVEEFSMDNLVKLLEKQRVDL